jgi:membrane protein required for colicin V production
VVAIVRQVVKLLLKAVGLGWMDRILGGLFGIARGLLVVLFGVLVAGLTPLPQAVWWREALLAPPFETVVIAAKPWMPQELAKRIGYR